VSLDFNYRKSAEFAPKVPFGTAHEQNEKERTQRVRAKFGESYRGTRRLRLFNLATASLFLSPVTFNFEIPARIPQFSTVRD